MSLALLMEPHSLLGVKSAKEKKKILYCRIVNFLSLSEETQTDLCCPRNVLPPGLQTLLGDGNRVSRTAHERCSYELPWGGGGTLDHVTRPELDQFVLELSFKLWTRCLPCRHLSVENISIP